MSGLVALSIACASFIGGFALGLMLLSVVRSLSELHDCEAGAPEGDQTTKFGQSRSSPR